MNKQYFHDNYYVINDYQNTKRFSSFLPMIAGEQGKPLWVFYANVGQCISSFGVDNKDYALTPFESAVNAYKNIGTTMFRTLLKINSEFYETFKSANSKHQKLEVHQSKIVITETTPLYQIVVTYSTVPNRSYAGLIRMVTIKNRSKEKVRFEIADGLPVILPRGLTTNEYFARATLMSSYCQSVVNHNRAFYYFATSIDDSAQVVKQEVGNGAVTYTQDGTNVQLIADLNLLFPDQQSLEFPTSFVEKDSQIILEKKQVLENLIPSAFSLHDVELQPDETYSFTSLYGNFSSQDEFNVIADKLSYDELVKMISDTDNLVAKLVPHLTTTSNQLFDAYLQQSFLDNGLRGGFPTQLVQGQAHTQYYLYSRKHGDMERDYNFFEVPSIYYSSGEGNFRDVLQNRRNDLYFYPFVRSANIQMFFSLVQLDGYNPLVVEPETFSVDNNDLEQLLHFLNKPLHESFITLAANYHPATLNAFVQTNQKAINIDKDEFFAKTIRISKRNINARFGEGYWIDHWTYLLDLVENYLSIYPDKEEELLFEQQITFYQSNVQIKSHLEKQLLLKNNVVRQLNALTIVKANITDHWIRNNGGKKIRVSLLNKLLHLVMLKYLTLDINYFGVMMEAGRPGWNDALNGLPGLFGSSFAETVELYRLVTFTLDKVVKYKNKTITVLPLQYELFMELTSFLDNTSNHDELAMFTKRTLIKEKFRTQIAPIISDQETTLKSTAVIKVLRAMQKTLERSITNVKALREDKLVATYFINEAVQYKLNPNGLDENNVIITKFVPTPLPLFLEANARLLKLGKPFFSLEMHNDLKRTELFDQTFKFYKTAVSLDEAPFEIGRIKAFSKGWLERESNFMHMTFKYILGLLKAGYHEAFFEALQHNLPIYFDPTTYGRSIIENSSFVVPTNHPNNRIHGQGFFARLTGANAEVLEMYTLLFFGKELFTYENQQLHFALKPILPAHFFAENNEIECLLFNKVTIKYINPQKRNTYDDIKLTYEIAGKRYRQVTGQLAEEVRDCKHDEIIVHLE